MSKVETKQGNVTLPKYMWNELRDDAKTLRLNTVSDLVYQYCKEGKARGDITPIFLKVANAKDAIEVKLDSILASRYAGSSGSLRVKFDMAMALSASYGTSSAAQGAKSSYQFTLFELFEELKEIDIEEYNIIMSISLKYGALRGKYLKYCNSLSGQTTLK